MKISWAVFQVAIAWKGLLVLEKSGFETERQAKKYVQHPDNKRQGSFVVLEVIEVEVKDE